MATVAAQHVLARPDFREPVPEPDIRHTMVDFRSKSTTALPKAGASTRTPSPHPELNNEVAALSEKLINSINHQTELDDLLSSTRHELEQAQQRIRELEAAKQEHADMVANGLLVERKDVETETNKLMRTISEERKQRGDAEKEKKSMEQELETLTTALFEEANQVGSCLFLVSTCLLTFADGVLRTERARRVRTPQRATQITSCRHRNTASIASRATQRA